MSNIVQEIENSIRKLGLSGQVKKLPSAKEQQLYNELVSEFLGGKNRQWWWEGFSKPNIALPILSESGFKLVPTLAPSINEPCWFMVEGVAPKPFPIYESTPETASRIIAECFAFEYYLISKDMSWLICENHHGRIIGVGNKVIEAIQNVTA